MVNGLSEFVTLTEHDKKRIAENIAMRCVEIARLKEDKKNAAKDYGDRIKDQEEILEQLSQTYLHGDLSVVKDYLGGPVESMNPSIGTTLSVGGNAPVVEPKPPVPTEIDNNKHINGFHAEEE